MMTLALTLIATLVAGPLEAATRASAGKAGFKRKVTKINAQSSGSSSGYLDFKAGFQTGAAAGPTVHAVNSGTPLGGTGDGKPLGPSLGGAMLGANWTKTSGNTGHNGVSTRVEQTVLQSGPGNTVTGGSIQGLVTQSQGPSHVLKNTTATATGWIDLGKVPVWQGKHGFDSRGRPVLEFRAQRKYSIKFRSNGTGSPNYAFAFGAVAWTVEAGSNYVYKASISKQPGIYDDMPRECRVTPDDIVFSLNPCERCVSKIEFQFNGNSPWMCNLEHNDDYYLNVEGDCKDIPELAAKGLSNGEKYGCSLSLEVSNGGVILLNPSGPAEACRARGWSWVEGRGCVIDGN